jgi:hypothetical protein
MKSAKIVLIIFISYFFLSCEASDKDNNEGSKSNRPPEVLDIIYHDLTWDGTENPLPTDISCSVTDPDGLDDIKSVLIQQGHIGNGNYPIEYQLEDNGTGMDVAANDGVFTKTFVRDLNVNALWYTNNVGHYWVCMATDRASYFFWKKIFTNPCCTVETGSGVNEEKKDNTNGDNSEPFSQVGTCTFQAGEGSGKICYWIDGGGVTSGLLSSSCANMGGTYSDNNCNLNNTVGTCKRIDSDSTTHYILGEGFTESSGASICDDLNGTWTAVE